jgi:hypothetical protein
LCGERARERSLVEYARCAAAVARRGVAVVALHSPDGITAFASVQQKSSFEAASGMQTP